MVFFYTLIKHIWASAGSKGAKDRSVIHATGLRNSYLLYYLSVLYSGPELTRQM